LFIIDDPHSVLKTPVDILPEVNIPVVSIVWSYNGLPPEDMGNRIVGTSERSLTTTVDDIEHG
jgi:multidrug efflux pump subunit AcrB